MGGTSLRRALIVLGLWATGAATAVTTQAQAASTFRGIPLPPPQPVRGVASQPPTAWLIVGHTAIAATFGSYCYGSACVDMVPPGMMPRIARVSVPPGAKVVVLIDVPRVRTVRATLSPWRGWSAGEARTLSARRHRAGTLAVLRLGRIRNAQDQVLGISVTFPPKAATTNPHVVGGDATYFWRINPRQ